MRTHKLTDFDGEPQTFQIDFTDLLMGCTTDAESVVEEFLDVGLGEDLSDVVEECGGDGGVVGA